MHACSGGRESHPTRGVGLAWACFYYACDPWLIPSKERERGGGGGGGRERESKKERGRVVVDNACK